MTQKEWVGGDAVCDYALRLPLRRALRDVPEFLKGQPGVIALLVSRDQPPSAFLPPIALELYPPHEKGIHDISSMAITEKERPENIIERFRRNCLQSHRAIVVAWAEEDLPAPVRLAVDRILNVEPMLTSDLQAACKEMLGLRIGKKQATEALTYPRNNLWDALRCGRDMDVVLARLREVCPSAEPPPKQAAAIPKLQDMHGYGEAKLWGMQLARDLQDWRSGRIAWADVDRGALLSGPPGVGKTMFATALAQQCETPLVATSFSQWQAKGHLGDMLRAMRSDFARARERAPTIFFVDELDSVGDRGKFSGQNTDYNVQVVNAFLECVDGTGGREGVVIIGATNDPTRIDPAVLRPGRLDKHVAISLPDADSRINIITQHLGQTLPDGNLDLLKKTTNDMTGADLQRLCREARRAARVAGRAVEFADLTRALPPTVPVSGAYRRRAAIHEAGHAIVGSRLRCGKLVSVTISDTVSAAAGAQSVGVAVFEMQRLAANNLATYHATICMLVAGIAAEHLVLGNFADGAGIVKDSDLEKATRLATILEAQTGLGSRLRYSTAEGDDELNRLLMLDRDLAANVEKVLEEQFSRAKTLLDHDHAFLNRLTVQLLERGSVNAAEFEALDNELNDSEVGPVKLAKEEGWKTISIQTTRRSWLVGRQTHPRTSTGSFRYVRSSGS